MASDGHVPEENLNENEEKPTNKLGKTVLDSFSNIVHVNEKVRSKGCINLLKHLVENEEKENENEIKYALGRIIRGLGSSNNNSRTGFYTALVGLLNFKDDITLDDIFQQLDKQLHKASSNSKGENADVCLGQVLTCGAVIRSKLWAKSPKEDQKKILEMLLKAAKERTYLSLPAYMFIIGAFDSLSEDESKGFLSLLQMEFSKPWAEQNLDTLFLLATVKNKYPDFLKGKALEKSLGTKDIVCRESVDLLCNVLMTIPRLATALNHPVYEMVCDRLAVSQHLPSFLERLDQNLVRPNRNKHLVATKILSIVVTNLTDKSLLPDSIGDNFVRQTINYFKSLKGKEKDDEFVKIIHRFFAVLTEALKPETVDSKTKIIVLKKLLFFPGTFIFEKVTRSKIAQQITLNLDGEGVKELAKVYRGVVEGTERIDSEGENETWLNNDRLYAAHLLVKLLNHAAVKGENGWKAENLKFLMEVGLLKPQNGVLVGCELAASLKNAFFGALDLKLSKLEDLHEILSKLVDDLNSKLNSENVETVLRTPMTQKDLEIWHRTVETIGKIEKKLKKGHGKLKSVFLTLFLHMGLQIFNDSQLAGESLEELFVCFEKTKKERKKSNESEAAAPDSESDPVWIEVVVDLFLNLLSQNLNLMRRLIKCVMPHLCRFMTPDAIRQILAVLDPKNEDNPLSKRGRNDEEEADSSDEEEKEDGDQSDAEEEDEDEDKSEDEEEDEMEDESLNDKLRMALHKVLSRDGAPGEAQSDEESVDLDQMSESEGDRLDEALAQAFKQFRPSKPRGKKQRKDDQLLTHFRVRVLDLIEIYLDSEPSMALALEIMLPLLQSVEFCVRDEHQQPLLDRLTYCLKKLSNLKKFSDHEGATGENLRELLQSLLERGTKNSTVVQFMGVQIAECCVFVIRCSDLLAKIAATPKKAKKDVRNGIAEVINGELASYFRKRDCLTPYVLFKYTMRLSWDGNLVLAKTLLELMFDVEVKAFKKNQAVELATLFYTNQRYLSLKPEKTGRKLSEDHSRFNGNVLKLFESLSEESARKNVKEKLVCNVFHLLMAMKTSCLGLEELDWPEIGRAVREYRSYVTFSNDAKSAFNKLCQRLGVSNVVEMKARSSNSDDRKSEGANGTREGEAEDEGKVSQKRKNNKKTKDKEKLKLKKEAKELRLHSLSEGFGRVDFVDAKDLGWREDGEERNLENGVDGVGKRKKNSESEDGLGEELERKKSKKKKKLAETLESTDESSKKRLGKQDSKTKKKKKIAEQS